MSLFVALLLGVVGLTSCTNDSTEDAKANYSISFVPSSLGADAEAAFMTKAAALLYAEETDNTRWIDYGLYSSREYAQNSYNAVKAGKYEFIQDSLVNVIADEYNLAPGSFSVAMVLKDANGNVLDNSAVWQPTIERQNLNISVLPLSDNATILNAISDSITRIYGAGYITGKAESVTPAYAKKQYGSVLAAELQNALTNICAQNGNDQAFSVAIGITGGESEYAKIIYPVTTYTVKYAISQGSLTEAQMSAMATQINTYVIGSAALSSYDIAKSTYASANQEFEDLLRKANNVLQNDIVNETAQANEINDFNVVMQLMAADGTVVNSKSFVPEITMDIYTIVVTTPGLSDTELATKLTTDLGDNINVGLHTQAKAISLFQASVKGINPSTAIADYAKDKKDITFDVEFTLCNSKGEAVDVLTYQAKDSWKYPTE